MRKHHEKSGFAVALAAISAASTAAAQESPFLLRARAVHVSPADKSDALGGVKVDPWLVGVGIGYRF